ncbi:fibronectin type III domain-containing protein [Clostridium sp. SHJSY1]|uniref:fibronectin type III domain-containing protein n=1 Tax=Clostridium sp. SHJSY1 TaxID=2942483 RepID=UPI002876450E|nr:fibronectin type III domain-containing protein [Clostridium sp. SHJSY1]MDS0528059.1 fibronectin type III domain-containing protein [Clostridium sp. SHJSY1]
MKKKFLGSFLFLVSLLLAFQLAFLPMNAFASTTNDVLPPSNLSYQLTTPSDIKLTWSSVYEATSYNVYGIIDGKLTLLGNTTTPYYNFSNLKEGTYAYVVSSISSYGESAPNAPVNVNIVYPNMNAPTGLTSKVQNGNDLSLSWTASSYAKSYNVYKTSSGGEKTLVTSVNTTTYSLTNAPAGSYTYEISAVNPLYGESPLSNPSQVDVVWPTMTAPGGFAYSLLNINDISLKWNSVPYATGYKVYQIIDGKKILKSTVTNTSVTYTNMPTNNYVYEIHSYSDRFGESTDGTQTSFNLTLPTMEAPTNLTYSIVNGNDITLKWNTSPYATGYKIYQIVNGQKTLKSTVTSTSITYTNMPGGNYSYEVHSYNTRFGESTDGSELSFNLILPTMQSPDNSTYSITNGNDITLKWVASPFATGYKIYQIVNGQKVLKNTVTTTSITYTNMPGGNYSYEIYSYSDKFGESIDGSNVLFSLITPTMDAPANIMQTVTSISSFSLNWDPSLYATSYKIYQIVNGQKVLKNTVTGTTISFTNMTPADYNFEIHSYSNRFGESQNGINITVTLNGEIMQPPTNLTYNITSGNDINLKWSGVQYATGYKIYQIIDGQAILKATVTSNSFTFSNMVAGDYKFIVNSVSKLLGESPVGAETNVSLTLPEMLSPNNLKYNITNINDVTLTWTASTYASSYKVYELINGQLILKTTVTSTTTSITGLSEGDHTFVVNSVSTRFGESQNGSQIQIPIVFPNMASPNNLTYSITNGSDIILNWATAPYATNYKIYQIIDGQKILIQTTTGTSFTLLKAPEGDYNYEVHSYSSRFGESQDGSSISFSLIYPTMIAPSTTNYTVANGNDITLKWTSSPFATSYKIYQIIDGNKILKQTVSATTATFSDMLEGNYNFEIHSYSSRFGESQDGINESFSLVYPTMLAPTNFTYSIANGNDITLSWGISQYATGYKIYQIINGQKVLKQTVTGTTTKFTNMPEGNYIFEIESYNSIFGESQDGTKVSFSLVFPTMVSPNTFAYKITNGNDLTLNWGSSPYANSYKIYQIINGEKILKYTTASNSLTTINLPEGNYIYEVHSYSDRFGESTNGTQLSFPLVYPTMLAPTNFTYSIANGNDITLKWATTQYTTNYRIYQIINGERVLKQTVTGSTYTFTNMPAGDYIYEVYSFSSRFGESPVGSNVNFQLVWPTIQPPTLSGTISNVNNIAFSWKSVPWASEYRLYELINGAYKLLYKGTALSFNIYNLSEGTHTYEISTYNSRFGESQLSDKLDKVIIYPDMQSPTVSLKLLSDTSAQLSWNFTAYTNGYNVYELINGIPVLIASNLNSLYYNITNLSYANHEYYVTAASNSFGQSDPSNIVMAKLIVDVDPPITSINAPTNWTAQNPVLITLSPFDKESGVAATYYSIDGGVFIQGTSFTISEEGIHKVSFYSVDKIGNVESVKTIYVKMDKIAPVTTSDATTSWSKDDVTINLTAIDSLSGIFRTFYSIDGSNFTEGTSFTIQSEGIHKVSFYSVDIAGNIESVNTIYVKMDRTAPITISNAPITWSRDNVTVNLTGIDQLSGIFKTFYSIDGSNFVEGTSFTIQSEGIHKVSFYSVDIAGNIESVNTIYVKVDRTAPTITMNLGDEYKLGTILQLNYFGTDSLSGIINEKMVVFKPNDTIGTILSNGSNIELDKPGVYTVMITVTDAAGNSYTIKKQFTVYIPGNIQVTANVINDNNGVITVRLDLPTGYNTQGVDLSTATLNGVNALTNNNGYYNQAKNGQFKFRRSDFTWTGSQMLVEFRCYINGYLVVGQATVKVQK